MRAKPHLCAAAAATLALASTASVARADDTPAKTDELECVVKAKSGLGLGFVFPSPGCKQTLTIDTNLSAVSNLGGFEPRLGAEFGYFFEAGASPLHIGAAAGVNFTDSFNASNPDASVDLNFPLRARYWWGGGGYPFMMFEAGLGPMISFPTTYRVPDRGGIYGELGMSIHGALGIFGSVEPSWSTADGSYSLRYSIGVKTTLVGSLIILAAYACAQGGGGACY